MKGWLLDTNVVSEWRKPKPERRVGDFLAHQNRGLLFISIVCLAEIRRGIEHAEDRDIRRILSEWLDGTLRPYFRHTTLEITEDIVLTALHLVDEGRKKRLSFSQVDVWIAATARFHGLTIVTRNTKDFARTGVPVFNPWTDEGFNAG